MKRKLPILLIGTLAAAWVFISFKNQSSQQKNELTSQQAWDKQLKEKKESKRAGSHIFYKN